MLVEIKLPGLANEMCQQVLDLLIFSLKVKVLRYEPLNVE